MLEFSLWDDDERHISRRVHINTAAVASVEETERRKAYGFFQPVAVIRLVTGEEHIVYDYARNVAKTIAAEQGKGGVMEMKIERAKTTVEVWNVCECGRILHSLSEAQRGTCSSCWVRTMPADTKRAMNRLIASVFNGEAKDDKRARELIDDAMSKLDRDREAQKGTHNDQGQTKV